MIDDIWPVAVIKSRYGGAYEGGEWVAIHAYFDDEELWPVLGGDIECQEWFEHPSHAYSSGATVEEALAGLPEAVEDFKLYDSWKYEWHQRHRIEGIPISVFDRILQEHFMPGIIEALNAPAPIFMEFRRDG